MKLSKKEQKLLLLLVVIIALFTYYQFIWQPQYGKVKKMQGKRDELKITMETTKKNVASLTEKEKEYKGLNSKIVLKTERFLPLIMQEKIIVTLDDMLSKTKLEAYSITFLDGKGEKAKESSTTSEKGVNENTLKKDILGVTITFKGSFTAVKNFISTLENFSKRTVITGITLSSDKDLEVAGNINLEFYALPQVLNWDKEYLQWGYNNKYGKTDPFIGESSEKDIVAASTEKKELKYDFLMTMKPSTADLPTVILGKAEDPSRNSYVYGDNSKEEPVEIYFTQVNEKYYYKYKTTREAYPKQGNGVGNEFVPYGNTITFKIYSNRRNSEGDTAGANIKIVNTTDKAVNVVIENEDSIRPRVKIISEGNSVVTRTE